MSANLKALYDGVRPIFGGKLTQIRVENIGTIVAAFEKHADGDPRKLAYMLATTYHETATRMEPVIETRQAGEAKNPSVDTAIARLESSWKRGRMPWVKSAYWRKDKNGRSWLGRGFPQCTHYPNYDTAEDLTGIPFTQDPDLMLIAENAAPAMVMMMMRGSYTGKKLGDYFSATLTDPKNARRVINGTESAVTVAGYYQKFYPACKAAMA